MLNEVYNANPVIFTPSKASSRQNFKQKQSIWLDDTFDAEDDGLEEVEEIDSQEIFDLIRSISDPEHPLSLEQLAVVSEPQVHLEGNRVLVEFTPTVPHCGMSTLIGLSIRVRLIRSLPQRFKIDVRVKPGTHQSEHALNKQLNDKERVAAALENHALLEVLERCLATAGQRGQPA